MNKDIQFLMTDSFSTDEDYEKKGFKEVLRNDSERGSSYSIIN